MSTTQQEHLAQLDHATANALAVVNGQLPIRPRPLNPGDLAYLRHRIARMAAFLDEDRKTQVVVDREFVALLKRYFGA